MPVVPVQIGGGLQVRAGRNFGGPRFPFAQPQQDSGGNNDLIALIVSLMSQQQGDARAAEQLAQTQSLTREIEAGRLGLEERFGSRQADVNDLLAKIESRADVRQGKNLTAQQETQDLILNNSQFGRTVALAGNTRERFLGDLEQQVSGVQSDFVDAQSAGFRAADEPLFQLERAMRFVTGKRVDEASIRKFERAVDSALRATSSALSGLSGDDLNAESFRTTISGVSGGLLQLTRLVDEAALDGKITQDRADGLIDKLRTRQRKLLEMTFDLPGDDFERQLSVERRLRSNAVTSGVQGQVNQLAGLIGTLSPDEFATRSSSFDVSGIDALENEISLGSLGLGLDEQKRLEMIELINKMITPSGSVQSASPRQDLFATRGGNTIRSVASTIDENVGGLLGQGLKSLVSPFEFSDQSREAQAGRRQVGVQRQSSVLAQQNKLATSPDSKVNVLRPGGGVVQVLRKTLTPERIAELEALGFRIP